MIGDLGHALLGQGEFAEAESFLRFYLAVAETKLPDGWRRSAAVSALGACLLGQKNYAEAEPMLLKGYAGLQRSKEKIPPTFRPTPLTHALHRRETPSGMTVSPFFPHNPGMPSGPPSVPAGQTDDHPAPIPMATGTFIATVSVSDMTDPIVVPVTIDMQTGAHFSTTIDAGGLQVNLKGELNQAPGTVHFQCTIRPNREQVGTASRDG